MTRSEELSLKRRGQSFPFRRKIHGRRVLKWITQRDLLMYTLVKLLVFTPLFNNQRKHVLKYVAIYAVFGRLR